MLDDVTFLPEEIVDLALWVGDYYLAGPGEVISTALPPKGWLRSDMTVALAEDAAARRPPGRPRTLRWISR